MRDYYFSEVTTMKRFSILMLGLSMMGLGSVAHAAEPLQTVMAQEREVAQTYSVDGVVEATHQATVSAQISGRVKAVMFDVGDRVAEPERQCERCPMVPVRL